MVTESLQSLWMERPSCVEPARRDLEGHRRACLRMLTITGHMDFGGLVEPGIKQVTKQLVCVPRPLDGDRKRESGQPLLLPACA